MNILSTHNLTKTYGTGDNVVHALTDVSLDIEEGKFVSIIGSSGSGKSTLLNLLGGLDRPTSGDVILDGKAIFEMDDEALTIFRRRKIGFVFQNYNLVPILNVYENIVLPIELDGTKIDTAYVDKIMDVLGLSEKKFSMPNQLSGGQQQRIAIARAVVTHPDIVLADEPTGNLDYNTSLEIMELFMQLKKEEKQSFIVVTHDPIIATYADRVIFLHDGEIKNEYKNEEGSDNFSNILAMFRGLVA